MALRVFLVSVSLVFVCAPQVNPTATYRQTKFQRHLYNTEKEAVYKFNFDTPKYHIVHNDLKRTVHDVPRAYRSVCCLIL